jgi:hypothetical protein
MTEFWIVGLQLMEKQEKILTYPPKTDPDFLRDAAGAEVAFARGVTRPVPRTQGCLFMRPVCIGPRTKPPSPVAAAF